MASIQLEARKDPDGLLTLRVRVAMGKQRLFFHARERVAVEQWDAARQRVVGPNAGLINAKLRKLLGQFEVAYRRCELAGGAVTRERLLLALDEPSAPQASGRLTAEVVGAFLEERRPQWRPGTEKDYLTTFRDLEAGGWAGRPLSDLDETGLRRLASQLLSAGNSSPTVAKKVSNVKSLLKWAVRRGLLAEDRFSDYRFGAPEVRNKPALTVEELAALERAHWPHPPYLAYNDYRDLLVFMCYTGLRYSDAARLEAGHVQHAPGVGPYLDLSTVKGSIGAQVPLLPQALAIIDRQRGRWGARLLPQVAPQTLNEGVKQLCRMAGVDAPWRLVRHRGPEREEREVPKWRVVSSHTGRITFITLGEQLGVPLTDLQQLVGHRRIQTTARYTRGTLDRRAGTLRQAWEKR